MTSLTEFSQRPDFWGPASNFGIPIAAVMDTRKDPDMCVANPPSSNNPHELPPPPTNTTVLVRSISGRMTLALAGYSGVFMRYAFAVTPRNYLLFGCHVVNFGAQVTQGYRFVDYWYMGGQDKYIKAKADQGLSQAEDGAKDAMGKAQEMGREAKEGAMGVADEAKRQVEKAVGR